MGTNNNYSTETCEAVMRCANFLDKEFEDNTVLFGFDGIVDTVREMVAERETINSHSRLQTLQSLGDQISQSAAAETSIAIEWLDHGKRTGGHVCHLSRVFGTWGFNPIMIGTFGSPITQRFQSEFGEYNLYSIGQPGTTDAVEFDDGKLMLTQSGEYRELDWTTLDERLGHDTLAEQIEAADLFGMGYWALIPKLSSIIEGLALEVWPTLSNPPEYVFLDPSDIRQLPRSTLEEGFDPLRSLNEKVPVTFSANRAELQEIVALNNINDEESILKLASNAQEVIGIDNVVAHSATESAMVTETDKALIETVHIDDPEIVTSSGDHFNAGICLGLLEGLDPATTVALGNAVAGTFIRTGESPTIERVASFTSEYHDQVCK